MLAAAVWRAAEPPAAEPAPEPAAEPAAEPTELEQLRKENAELKDEYAEAKDEKVELEDYIGNVCSMIENEVAFENLQEWLQEMKDKDLYRPGESEDDSEPAAEPAAEPIELEQLRKENAELKDEIAAVKDEKADLEEIHAGDMKSLKMMTEKWRKEVTKRKELEEENAELKAHPQDDW